MIDEQKIREATEEVLRELNLDGWRFEVEPALAAAHEDVRQIRLFEPSGEDKAVVIDFQDAEGNVSGNREDIKAKIRKQLETLVKISG